MKNEINILSILGKGENKEFFPEFFGCTLDGGENIGEARFYVLQETLETDLKNESVCYRFVDLYSPIQRIQRYRDLAMGLVKMHGLNLSHEDLKPENVMIKDKDFSNLKIIDFGMVCSTNENVFGGSPLFNSPEKIKSLKGVGRCHPKHDIWALGLTIAVIEGKNQEINKNMNNFCFRSDFTHNCYKKIFENVSSIIDLVFGKSNTFTKLLKKMISFNPEDRPTAKKIVKIIDSMTDEEKSSEIMNSKINNKNKFIISEDSKISDISNLIKFHSNIPEINKYYQQRYEEKKDRITYEKDLGEENLNDYNKITYKSSSKIISVNEKNTSKIISEQSIDKKGYYYNKNIIIYFGIFMMIVIIIIASILLRKFLGRSDS